MEQIAVVTGANQGLGLALVRRLASELGPSGRVYLTARDAVRGAAAQAQLRAEGLDVALEPLDVGDDASVTACAERLRARHGAIAALISNAGTRITPDRSPADQVDEFVNVNNLGTTRVLEAFAPLLASDAHVVVVGSGFGSLRRLPPEFHPLFDAPGLSLAEIDAVMRAYATAVKSGSAEAEGWPDWINVPSKVAQTAAMRVFARDLADDPRGIVVNAACPGLVDTAASRPWFSDMSQAQSPDEAAVDVAWLAMEVSREAGPYGELVQHRQIIPWR